MNGDNAPMNGDNAPLLPGLLKIPGTRVTNGNWHGHFVSTFRAPGAVTYTEQPLSKYLRSE